MISKYRRIVVFTGTGQCHMCQMLVHKVHTQDIFPITKPFEILESFIPASATICFTQCTGISHLVSHTTQLFYRTDITKLCDRTFLIKLIEQHINRRRLMPGIHSHIIRSVIHVRPTMFPIMAGPFQLVFLAILVERL